jgi:hypothetical protein
MNETVGRREHRFVVRVWLEPGQEASGQWRGAVEHVGSGQRLYFASLGDLNDFIALRLGDSSSHAPAQDRT